MYSLPNLRQYAPFALLVAISVLLLGLSACEDPETPEPSPDLEYLVDYDLKRGISRAEMVLLAQLGGFGEFINLIKTGIDIYRISYNTTYNNASTIASGVVAVPRDPGSTPPVLGAFRGTIFADDEAPSTTSTFYGFELIAASEYIAVLPDYIGFGETSELVHPYYNEPASAQASADAIRAAMELMQTLQQEHSEKLFLFGYSQGGYNTVATLRLLQQNPVSGLSITASAAGAGSYNIPYVMQDVLNMQTYTSPAFLAFIIYSFNEVNGWNRPLSDFFQEPYLSRIPGVFDGTLNRDAINSQLTNDLGELFAPDFLEGLLNGTETQVLQAFEANSVDNWAPQTPLRLYHSTGDQYIPLADSENTAQLMTANGAPSVSFVEAGNETHESAVFDIINLVVPWFESLK